MKKIFITGGLLFCVLSAPLSFCSDGDRDLYAEDDSSDCENSDCRSAFDGFFIGGGFMRMSVINKVVNTKDIYSFKGDLDCNLIAPLNVGMVRQNLADASGIEIVIDSITTDAAQAHLYEFTSKASEGHHKVASAKGDKVGVSLTAGCASLIGNFYYGGQISIDCCNKKTKEETDNSYKGFGKIKTESCGVTPSFSLLVGKYEQSINAVVGVKLGLCKRKSNVTNSYGSVKMSKTVPTVGLFFRKGVNSHFSFNLEFDYLLQTSKKGQLKWQKDVHIINTPVAAPPYATIDLKHIADVAVRNKGYVVRITGTYRI